MPFLVGPIIAGGLSALAGSTLFGLTVLQTALLVGGANLALGLLARALAPKPKFPSLSNLAIPRTQNIRQAIVFRRGLYGEGRIAGPFTFITVTNNKTVLHIITPLLWHESEAVVAYQIDDDIIYPTQLNGLGEVQTGKYSLNGTSTQRVMLRFHNGASGQVADTELLGGEFPATEVDANFIGEGITYLYTRLLSSQSLFNGRIPNISVWLKGAKVLDTRDDVSRWNPNPSLCIRDYLTDSNYGMETNTSDIDDDETDSAANVCEEFVDTETIATVISGVDFANDILQTADDRLQVITGDRVQITTTGTLPSGLSLATNYYVITIRYRSNDVLSAGMQLATSYANALAGTQIDITSSGSGEHTVNKNAEPRYTSNGAFETDTKHGQVLDDLRQSMAGRLLHAGDTWKIRAGAYIAPTITLEQTDMSGPEGLNIRTKHALNDRFNSVKGLFVSPGNDGVPADYPIITNSTFITEDNGRTIFRDIDFVYINRPHTAMRVAKIELERHRQEITISCFFTLTALRLQIGDVYNYSNTRMGFSGKAFECSQWKFNLGQDRSGAPLFRVFMAGRETASAVFDWASGEETTFDLASNTTLPKPGDPVNPTGLTLQSGDAQLFVKSDGTVVSRIRVSWTSSVDGFVSGYEVQFKKSADIDWSPVGIPNKDSTHIFIWDVEDGINYDVRIRAIDHWEKPALTFVVSSNHTVVGKSELPSDVTSFQIEGTTFSWQHSLIENDLDGFVIRYHFGNNISFGDANPLHTGVLKSSPYTANVLPSGTITFMIKAVDTSGNFSNLPSFIVTEVGDALVANVVESFDFRALGFPGTITGGVVDGNGDLVANSVTPIWDADSSRDMWTLDAALFYIGNFAKLVYEDSFTPSTTAAGSIMTIIFTAVGDSLFLEYRQQAPTRMWASNSSEIMWSVTATDLMWSALTAFEPWPGSIIAVDDLYDIRATAGFGTIQGKITALKVSVDVPDIEELLADVAIASGGTRLILSKTFQTIQNVQLTLQDDGGSAVGAQIVDKSVQFGPLIKAVDDTGADTTAIVDATIQGF